MSDPGHSSGCGSSGGYTTSDSEMEFSGGFPESYQESVVEKIVAEAGAAVANSAGNGAVAKDPAEFGAAALIPAEDVGAAANPAEEFVEEVEISTNDDSSSSFEGAHGVVANPPANILEGVELRTANDSSDFFEGAEKRIFILFSRKDGANWDQNCDLRQIPRESLETLLGLVNCRIISSISNFEIDAYVLSESSLFIGKRYMVLKTCGNTTPLHCLQLLSSLVTRFTKFDAVESLYYSHKNFLRPELQTVPYRKFENEIEILDTFLNQENVSNYVLGSLSRECYYLYTFDADFARNTFGRVTEQTLEVIMNKLDPEVMKIFTQKESTNGRVATLKSGIHQIIPGMVIDDFLFEPCGYSMNGIMEDGSYMTIHITPERSFSFVSFETNVALDSYREVVGRVVDLFNPERFMVTFFSEKMAGHDELNAMDIVGARWIRHDSQYNRLDWTDLTYAYFAKF
ncbi:S-adenosylmethionine decarboxylase proenzyme [Orchesella cincta]|uniref:adenosylmethionine decarboxylase n=1 Tax=Orchesella cincta TaxID=48709 RepID=A0A1D2M5E6_ORCCI|nr:S-adenosylmethionine decarboxylase proenzyme [Orchesella cincta]